MTRFVLPFIFAAFVWTGCTTASFTDPMPLNRRNLNHFPAKWQGTWTDGNGLTLQIHPGHLYDEQSEETIVLGETALLRRFHGYLVLNKQEEDPSRWTVTLGRRWKDEIHLWEFESSNEEAVAVWREILQAESLQSVGEGEKQTYVLSPENNAAFRQLITRGGITSSGTLRRKSALPAITSN